MLESTAYLEILREVIFPVESHHCLAHHAVVCVAFETYVDRCSGVDDALVEYGNLAGRVVYTIVRAFTQHHTASSYHHRALRHVVCTERYYVGRCSLVLSCKNEFVFLCNLFCGCFCRVIQFGEGVFVGCCLRYACRYEIVSQVRAERFGSREKHTSVADGISVDEVKVAVRVRLVVIVQTVGSQYSDYRPVLYLRFGQIGEVYACGVVLIFHVEAELGLLYCRCKIVYVLHHQPPVGHLRAVVGVFQ